MGVVNTEKRIIDMTAGEFAEVLYSVMQRLSNNEEEKVTNKRLVYGIAGIAQLFNCSMTTANRIKASGKIDQAISQTGRMITVDADLALQLMKI
ncbi:MAG: DUF3853 family protein [Alloprevotella sp.]|nr:MAG: DUF3853 family protein [Alloprevotella sp.]